MLYVVLGTLEVPQTLPGSVGANYFFLKLLRFYLPFLFSCFLKCTAEFSGVCKTCNALRADGICDYIFLCFKNFPVLTSVPGLLPRVGGWAPESRLFLRQQADVPGEHQGPQRLSAVRAPSQLTQQMTQVPSRPAPCIVVHVVAGALKASGAQGSRGSEGALQSVRHP